MHELVEEFFRPAIDRRRAMRLACRLAVGGWCLGSLPASGENLRWPDERRAGPFVCHADFPLRRHERLLGSLGRLQHDITQTLGVGPTRQTVHLFLFSHESTYSAYMRRHFPDVPRRRALYIKGGASEPGMVFAHENTEFAVDLRHESTHALLHASLPVVPLWLDEGLAEYFESPMAERAYDSPHLNRVRWGVRFGRVHSMRRLERLESIRQMGDGEYRSSWAWVHFMLHGPTEARVELVDYLHDLQEHAPPGVLSERLLRRVPDLDAAMKQHFKTWRKPGG